MIIVILLFDNTNLISSLLLKNYIYIYIIIKLQ